VRKFSLVLLATLALGSSAYAQEKSSRDPMTFGIRETGSKFLNGPTYVVPTVILDLSVDGSVWAIKQGGGASAKGHGKFWVSGIDKQFAQDLAARVQADLIQRMKAAGLTVKSYDEIKGDPEWAKQDRFEPNKDYGMPTDDQGEIIYVIAAPSDDQAIKGGLRGYIWGLRKFAKNVDAITIVPRYTIASPQMWGEKGSGYKRVTASIEVQPGMTLVMVTTQFVDQNEKGGYTMLPGGHREVADEVGELIKGGTEKYNLGTGSGFMGSQGAITGVKSVWLFKVDRAAYTDAVMYAAGSYNQNLVDQIMKQRSK
jgi:hypothetical protein